MSCIARNSVYGFFFLPGPGLKVQIFKVAGKYYPYREIKGTYQLRGYLHICFDRFCYDPAQLLLMFFILKLVKANL